jgi:hypothetical protein
MNWLYGSLCCFVTDMFFNDILYSKVDSNLATSIVFNTYITIEYFKNVDINGYVYGYLLYEISNNIIEDTVDNKESIIIFYIISCTVIEYYPDMYRFLPASASISSLALKFIF